MMQLQSVSDVLPPLKFDERRRHQRVAVKLLGRYMLENRQEYPCQSMNVSPGGILLLAMVKGAVGEKVVGYFEHLGRIEGQVVRHTPTGFAVTILATLHKRDKLANQLTWLANRSSLGLPDDRRHERISPRNPQTMLRLEDGRECHARLLDISLSGAAVSVDIKPLIGTAVVLGKTPGKVVRHFKAGIAIEFRRPFDEDRFDEDITP